MLGRRQFFFATFSVGLVFQSNMQCMISDYSYVQYVINTRPNFESVGVDEADIFPKFPSSLSISDNEFICSRQYGSVFSDDYGVVFLKVRYGLYTLEVAENTFIRVLISIKLIPGQNSAYYILNIDNYRAGKILNTAVILPQKLGMNEQFAKFVLPVEEIIEQLEEIVTGFKRNS